MAYVYYLLSLGDPPFADRVLSAVLVFFPVSYLGEGVLGLNLNPCLEF